MLAHHTDPNMAMNYSAFNAMYVKLEFLAPDAAELVRTKGINSLRLLGCLNFGRGKSFVKAICRPGGAAIGHTVS